MTIYKFTHNEVSYECDIDAELPHPETGEPTLTSDYLGLTSDEISTIRLNALRKMRDQLISKTDWWVLPDRVPTAEQSAYRQALRDITEIYTSLEDVVWPTNPLEATP